MIITTTDFIPQAEITAIKEVVFSEQVISVNVAKDIISGIKGIFGGNLEGYTDEYHKAREAAIIDLRKQAEAIGGDAIINLSVSYNEFINADMFCIVVTAYGTAVSIKTA